MIDRKVWGMMNETMKRLLCDDVLYDGKSLIYQEGVMEQVEDPMDSDTVPEGRMGEFRLEQIRTRMGVVLQLPVTGASRGLSAVSPEEDSETCYRRCAADRILMLEKMDASQAARMVEDLSADDDLVSWGPDTQLDRWAGLVTVGASEPMLGIVSAIAGKDGSVYILRYAGVGNFTDIRMEETEIMKGLYRRVTR